MKKRISSFALTSLLFSTAFAIDESPSLVSQHEGETISAASVHYNVHLSRSERLFKTAVGIDDTLNTFSADVAPLVAGRSFASGLAYAHSRLETTDSGDGIREIRIVHKGRIALKAPESFEETDNIDVNFSSYNHLSFAPYRISGNQSPVSLAITCEVADCIMQDPTGSQSAVDVNLYAGHNLSNFANGTNVSNASGSIELETAHSNEPGFIFDLMANGTSTDLGNGRFRVNSNYAKSVTTGYLNKFDFVSQHVGALVCGGFMGNDTEPWLINSGGGVIFKISSPDPTVRFFIYSKENPAPAPDLQIGRTSRAFKGAEIMQSTPASAQKAKIKQGGKRKKTFYLRLMNHGPDACGGSGDNAIRLKGPRRKKSLKLTYFQSTKTGFENVTGKIASGRYLLPGHFSSYGEDFKVVSKRGKRGTGTGRQTMNRVTMISRNSAGGGRDVVQAFILTK